jgi:hypothetical protein
MKFYSCALFKMPTALAVGAIIEAFESFSRDKLVALNVFCLLFASKGLSFLRELDPSRRHIVGIIGYPSSPSGKYDIKIARDSMTCCNIVVNYIVLLGKSQITSIGIFASYLTHTNEEFLIRHITVTKPTDILAIFGLICDILEELLRILTKGHKILQHSIFNAFVDKAPLASIAFLETGSCGITGDNGRKIDVADGFAELGITISSFNRVGNTFLFELVVSGHNKFCVVHSTHSFLFFIFIFILL